MKASDNWNKFLKKTVQFVIGLNQEQFATETKTKNYLNFADKKLYFYLFSHRCVKMLNNKRLIGF